MGLVLDDEGGVGAYRDKGADVVSNLELGDGRANSINNAGIIRAWDERQRMLLLVLALYLKVSTVVQAGGLNFDSHCCG